jgi:hypothetical protein
MKNEVKTQLKENWQGHFYTDERYKKVVDVMKLAMGKDDVLKKYLSISPDFKVNFICDHIVKYAQLNLI